MTKWKVANPNTGLMVRSRNASKDEFNSLDYDRVVRYGEETQLLIDYKFYGPLVIARHIRSENKYIIFEYKESN